MKSTFMLTQGRGVSRTPRGVRGLKSFELGNLDHTSKSHPSRGAWIEISAIPPSAGLGGGRTPRGVRGLKFRLSVSRAAMSPRRTPRGVRGLKLLMGRGPLMRKWSHPSRGAWIEIAVCQAAETLFTGSHPSRGAWIEIIQILSPQLHAHVAPLAGCVD